MIGIWDRRSGISDRGLLYVERSGLRLESQHRLAPKIWRSTAMEAVISVMLIVPDAQRAASWYQQALGATRAWDLGSVVGLLIDGAPFFLHEVNPDNRYEKDPIEVGATSTRIELFVDDPGAVLSRATAAGATLISAVEEHDAPWGKHRQGGFRDPFGHKWSIGDRSPIAHRTRS